MLKKIAFCLITAVLFTGLAYAHGDPIMGTITAVTTDTFTIKNEKDSKPLTIMLVKTTKYLKDEKPAKKADLKVGDRVVIDAEMDTKMKMYSAEEIKIGAAVAAKPATPAKSTAPATKK